MELQKKVDERGLSNKQKINIKIKELKKLSKIDKDIAILKVKISKLEKEKKQLEIKYDL